MSFTALAARRSPCLCEALPSPRMPYDRLRDLPRLLALWPEELAVATEQEHRRLIARLRTALRRERLRGLAGNWSYDLARHAALLAALRAEDEIFRVRHGRWPGRC